MSIHDAKEETHESFGLIQISRISGGRGDHLYGSAIEHNHRIALRINKGKTMIDGEREWYFSDGNIIEVEMSTTQFAEAITTLNVGDGVPCTITRKDRNRIEGKKFSNKRIKHEENFKQRMLEIEKRMESLVEFTEDIMKSKKNVKVSDREQILKEIRMLKQEVKSNIPYFQKQFGEEMDKVVVEAKGEVEAYVTHKVQQLGLNELNKIKLLEENKDEK